MLKTRALAPLLLLLLTTPPVHASVVRRICEAVLSLSRRSVFTFQYSSQIDQRAASGLLGRAGRGTTYAKKELRVSRVRRDVDVVGLREIDLDASFGKLVQVHVGSTADLGLFAGDGRAPAPGHAVIGLEITADPDHVQIAPRVIAGVRLDRVEGVLSIKMNEGFGFRRVMNGIRGHEARYAGIGPTRVILFLPTPEPEVQVFRGDQLIRGEWSRVSPSAFARRIANAGTDRDRLSRLREYVRDLPAGRAISLADFRSLLEVCEWSESRVTAVTLMKPKLTMSDRMAAHDLVREVIPISTDVARAQSILRD